MSLKSGQIQPVNCTTRGTVRNLVEPVWLVVVVGDPRASEEAALEGDRECVEGGPPAVHPAFLAGAVRVERTHDEVEAFRGRLFVGEIAAGSGRSSELGVQRLDRVGRIEHPSDLGSVVQERHELRPRGGPQRLDGRVAVPPNGVELIESRRGGFAYGGVDGPQLAGHLVPVFTAGKPERVADQVQHTGLHERQRTGRFDRLGQSTRPQIL